MAELYRIDNTESMGTKGARLWVKANQVIDLGRGYKLFVHFDRHYPNAAPVVILQTRHCAVYLEDLHPGAFVDVSRWTGLLVIPRATQHNRRGGVLRLLIDFVPANQVKVG